MIIRFFRRLLTIYKEMFRQYAPGYLKVLIIPFIITMIPISLMMGAPLKDCLFWTMFPLFFFIAYHSFITICFYYHKSYYRNSRN